MIAFLKRRWILLSCAVVLLACCIVDLQCFRYVHLPELSPDGCGHVLPGAPVHRVRVFEFGSHQGSLRYFSDPFLRTGEVTRAPSEQHGREGTRLTNLAAGTCAGQAARRRPLCPLWCQRAARGSSRRPNRAGRRAVHAHEPRHALSKLSRRRRARGEGPFFRYAPSHPFTRFPREKVKKSEGRAMA